MEQQVGVRTLVAGRFRPVVGVLEQWTGGVEVGEAHQAAGERDARALVELQPACERPLDCHATLEEPWRDLECPGLRHRDARYGAREQLVDAGVLRVPEGGTSARECGTHATLE